VGVFEGGLRPAPAAPAGEWRAGEIPQREAVAFGARWQNIGRMRLESTTAVAQLALAREFEGDLAQYGCHPALADMAATFGLHLLDAGERRKNLFVPLSIDRIRLAAPLPRELVSRVTLKGPLHNGVAAFDVAVHSVDGLPLATFEGFSMRGVQPGAMTRDDRTAARRQPGLVDAMLACGIQAADAPALFERVFAGAGRDVTVSSIAIDELRRAMAGEVPRPARRAAPDQGPAHAQDESFNAVEGTIAQAWRDLLGVDEVRREDDFFALGGHSLAAVRLFARIRKHFSVDLPLATLFQAPTLGALAALVAHAGGLDVPPPADEPRKPASNVISLGTRAWSPLVAICKGRPERKPLFCVHGAGGNVLNFKVLSDRLGPELPFYGLQAQGADGRLPPLPSIEAMASQYVEAIRTVDPVGPYRLAGYSAGGVIALEMAHQLIESGGAVSLLVMIDTLSPDAAARKVPYLRKLWLARHWSLGFLLDWPGRRRRGKLVELNYALALEKLSRGESLPPELVEHHLFRNFITAQALHKPRSYPGNMVLFKATESEMQYLQAGRSLGWDGHVRGDIRVTDIAGSHFSMLSEPGVSQLVEGLRREIEALDERPLHPRTRAA
jgi:thioesterase domain-containing protein/acyl carrier protein